MQEAVADLADKCVAESIFHGCAQIGVEADQLECDGGAPVANSGGRRLHGWRRHAGAHLRGDSLLSQLLVHPTCQTGQASKDQPCSSFGGVCCETELMRTCKEGRILLCDG